MTPATMSNPAASLAAGPTTVWPGLVSLALGALFILGVGFTHMSAAHNAAHDARHAANFPCH